MSYYDWGRRTSVGLPRDAYRPSPIFLGILAVFVGFGALTWFQIGSSGLNVFLFVVAGWLVSLCFHEYAHALVAYRAGDYSIASRGYLKLNPLKYAHPVLSVVLPLIFILLGGIALPGGAVYVDNHSLRSRRQQAMVSLAGPAVNALFAFILMLPFAVGVNWLGHETFWAAIALLGFFQISAAILNLLPVPGLDGGNAIYPYLNPDWKRAFDVIRPWGMLALVLLLYYTVLRTLFFDAVYGIMGGKGGAPAQLSSYGLFLFQFWRH